MADQSDVYSHVLRRLCHRLGTGTEVREVALDLQAEGCLYAGAL